MTDLLNTLGITIPVIQAPMAGVDTPELAIGVSKAGGLGSLACALRSPDEVRAAWAQIRGATAAPVNLNFFCHVQHADTPQQQERWKKRLAPYYGEFALKMDDVAPSATRAPFDENFCRVVEDIKPPVVSFHFGLPAPDLLARVKATGAIILSSATTVAEAIWLERHGCDAVIAQGVEAGGHRALFLSENIDDQPETLPLLTAIRKAIKLPVIAAGGIADAQGVRNALSHGAAAAQMGTAYLFCPEARVSPLYRKTLGEGGVTALTNIFSGRPARGIVNRFMAEVGPISPDAPAFPYASTYVNPLRQASEKAGRTDFMQMWSGTNRVPHALDAQTFTRTLWQE